MGFTHSQRIQRTIISRRRTQFYTPTNETYNYRATGGSTGDYQTREEEFTWTTVGYGDEERLDETDER